MKIILLFGPPASGKSTQSDLLRSKEGVSVVSFGEIYRDFKKQALHCSHLLFRTQKILEGYSAIEALIEKGQLLPNTLTNEIASNMYRVQKECHTLVFDGYPRNIKQARAFEVFAQENINNTHIIELSAPKHILQKRARERNREDCNSQIFEKRYDLYIKHTQSAIEYLRNSVEIPYSHILSMGSPFEIHSSICRYI